MDMKFEKLRVREIRGVLRYRPSQMRWNASNRRDHIIGIQLSGSALHEMEGQKFVLRENVAYFLNRKDDYRVEVEEAGEALSIHFTTYEEIETDSFCFPAQNAGEIVTILKKAEGARAAGNELRVLALLYELCDAYEKIRARAYAPQDGRMLAAKNYIDRHFAEDGCLAEAIGASGLCDRRFRDLFRASFQTTPGRYLTLKRIEYARQLLSVGGLSVTEVAERCGFSDLYYFSKVFKQICGMPPSEW